MTAAASLGISRQGLGKEIASLEAAGHKVKDDGPVGVESASEPVAEASTETSTTQEETQDGHHE